MARARARQDAGAAEPSNAVASRHSLSWAGDDAPCQRCLSYALGHAPQQTANQVTPRLKRPVFLIAGFIIATLGLSSSSKAVPVREPEPLPVEGSSLSSVYFTQLFLHTGPVAGDTLKDEHVRLFNAELRHWGYSVPQRSAQIFGPTVLPRADYYLMGHLTEFECSKQKRTTCGLTIEWHLVQSTTGQLAYRVVVHHEEMRLRHTAPNVAARELLLGGLRSLLSRRRFVRVLSAEESWPPRGRTSTTFPSLIEPCPASPHHSEADIVRAASAWVRHDDQAKGAIFISPDGFLLAATPLNEETTALVRLHDGSTARAEVVSVDRKNAFSLLHLVDHPSPTPCVSATILLAPPVHGADSGWWQGEHIADLDALGVRFGKHREAPPEPSNQTAMSKSKRELTDREDPRWYYVGTDAPFKRPSWVTPLLTLGGVSLAGGVGLLATYAVAPDSKALLPAGFTGVAVGTSLLIGTVLVRAKQTGKRQLQKNTAKRGRESVTLSPAIGLGFVGFSGKF